MTMTFALWVLDQEAAWARRNFSVSTADNDPTLFILGSTFGIGQTAAISLTPYYQISRQADAFRWVADDLAYTKKSPIFSKLWPRTLSNYHPELLRFARRGGVRAISVRIGSRFIPYAGWALLAWDLWNVGKWIGEKTS